MRHTAQTLHCKNWRWEKSTSA